MIFFAITLLSLTIGLYLVWISYRRQNYFTIGNLIFISFVFVYILPIYFLDESWTRNENFLFVIFIGLLAFFIGIIFFNHSKITLDGLVYLTNNFKVKYMLKKELMSPFFLLLSSYYLIQLIILKAYFPSNFISLVIRDRVGDYLANPIANTMLLMSEPLEILSLLCICFYWSHRSKKGIFLWVLLFLVQLLTSPTRFVLITTMVLPIFFYNYYVKRVRFITIVPIFIGVIIFVGISNFVRGGQFSTGNITLKSILNYDEILNQIFRASAGSTKYFYDVYLSNIPFDLFKQYYYYLPITLIPRFLWSSKPIVSYFWRITKEITGAYPAGKSNPVLTTTLFGEGYHQFGIVGIVFSMWIYLYILKKVISYLKNFEYSGLVVLSLIINIPMDIRGGLASVIISKSITLFLFICLKKMGIYYKITDKLK